MPYRTVFAVAEAAVSKRLRGCPVLGIQIDAQSVDDRRIYLRKECNMKATMAGVAGGDVTEFMHHKDEADSLKAKAHSAIDSAAERAKSFLAGMAAKSHAMTDKTTRGCDKAYSWMGAQRKGMGELGGKGMDNAAGYAKAKPLKALGLGLLAGVVLARLI